MNQLITLATLHTASLQAIFDQAARHLLTQNEQSKDGDSCMYQSPTDNKTCGAGIFISATEYDEDFEHHQFDDVYGKWQGKAGVEQPLDPAQIALMMHIQTIHDQYEPKYWRQALQDAVVEIITVFPGSELSFDTIAKEFPT